MKRQREKPCIFRFLKTVIRLLRWRIFSILPQKEFYLLYKLLSYPNKIFHPSAAHGRNLGDVFGNG